MSCSEDFLDIQEPSEVKNIYSYEVRVKRVYLYDSVLMARLKTLNLIERGKLGKPKEGTEEMEEEMGEHSGGETEEEEFGGDTEEDEEMAAEIDEQEEQEQETTTEEVPKTVVDKKLKDYLDNVEYFDLKNRNRPNIMGKTAFDQLANSFGLINISEDFESDTDLEPSEKTESTMSLDYLKFIEDNLEEIGSKLKVIIPLYGADNDAEIKQDYFVDNINEMIMELSKRGAVKFDDPGLKKQKKKNLSAEDILKFCEDVTTTGRNVIGPNNLPDEPVDIEEYKAMSLHREIVIKTPFSIISSILNGPLIISIGIERIISPIIPIGTCRMRFGQQFINAIVTAATSVQKSSVLRRVKLPIRNNFEEQVGILYLFLKMTCLGPCLPKIEPFKVEDPLPSNSEFERTFTGEGLE